jgi:hypothetical protein
MDEGVQLLELARNAQLLFAKQEPREKYRLLNFVLSNCTWGDGEVVATFREPFDLLAENHHDRRPRCCGRDGQIGEKCDLAGAEGFELTNSSRLLL